MTSRAQTPVAVETEDGQVLVFGTHDAELARQAIERLYDWPDDDPPTPDDLLTFQQRWLAPLPVAP